MQLWEISEDKPRYDYSTLAFTKRLPRETTELRLVKINANSKLIAILNSQDERISL